MRFTIRHLLWLTAIAPPLLAGAWWYGPPVVLELRLRMNGGMVEMSGPQLQDFPSIEKPVAVPSYVGIKGAVNHGAQQY